MTSLLLILLVARGSGQIQTDSAGTLVSVQSNLSLHTCNQLVGHFAVQEPSFPLCVNAAELSHFLTRLECVPAPKEQQPPPTFIPSDDPGGTALRLTFVRYTCKKHHL